MSERGESLLTRACDHRAGAGNVSSDVEAGLIYLKALGQADQRRYSYRRPAVVSHFVMSAKYTARFYGEAANHSG